MRGEGEREAEREGGGSVEAGGGQGLDPNGAAGHTVGDVGARARARGGLGGRRVRKSLEIHCVCKGDMYFGVRKVRFS